MTWRWTAAVALTAALGASGCCCGLGGLSEEDRARAAERRAQREQEREAARQNAPTRAARIPALAQLIDPSAPVPERRCPDEQLRADLGAEILRATIPSADYGTLADPNGTEGWRWLDHEVLGYWRRIRESSPDVSDTLLEDAGGADNRYLVVFTHRERGLPAITRGDGLIRSGQYDAGYYEGGLFVIDVDQSRVVCSAPFSAESSEHIDGDDDFDEALEDDFRERFEDAANGAIDRISDHISVNVHGLL